MARTKTGPTRRKKHKEIKRAAKGFSGHRGRSIRGAKEGLMHAGQHAYGARRRKKRDIRQLWIQRINAAVKEHGLSYSDFMHELKKQNIELNRKILAHLAVSEPKIFEKIVKEAKK